MGGIDQVKHPMRFAVVASTVSGLLVALLTAAAGKAFRSSMSWHVLLPWLFLPGWALAAMSLILRAHRRERRPGRVFFIVAAFTHKHWVPQLIRDLHENLERRGYDMVLKIPDRDYSGASQIRLLDGILSRRHEYAGGFIMVNEADAIRADLAAFCGKAGMPVVFIDAEPFDSESAYPAGTAFVGCDDGADWRNCGKVGRTLPSPCADQAPRCPGHQRRALPAARADVPGNARIGNTGCPVREYLREVRPCASLRGRAH